MATPKPLAKHKKANGYQELKQVLMEAKENILPLPQTLELSKEKDFVACCFRDSNNKKYYLLSDSCINSLIESAKELEKNKYLFKLEQEIYKNMPIDFEDVWCIALKELAGNFNKNPKNLIKNIRKRYPYLFMDFNLSLNQTY